MRYQLPIRNFPAQQQIFDSPAQYVIVPKGRRFGLTKGTANNYIKLALLGEFKKGLWVDTINANIEKYVERYFIPALRKLSPRHELWNWRIQQKILEIKDSYIDFRSVDKPENIEGFGYDYAFLNEAGIILKDEYLWNNAIRPMLWDYKCKTIIGGTPKGQGVFHELAQRGQDPEQSDFAYFHFTSFDNPYLPKDVIEEDMKSMPQRVIDQEIYAKFLDDTGIVFRGVGDVAMLDPKGQPPEPEHIYVMGADLAKLVDYTVLAVYDRGNNHQVYQMRFNHLEWPFIRSKIKETSKKYNNALVMLDSTGVGEPTYDDLSRSGVPVEPIHFTNQIKKDIIEKLANWIELRNLKMLDLDETKRELTQFTYDISDKTDRVFYGAPVGFHDDIVISHALACWSLQPLIAKVPPKEISEIARDFKNKLADYNDGEEGEFGEYEDQDNTYTQNF